MICPECEITDSHKQKCYYLRRCKRCSNFMNWRVRSDGTAKCLDCGTKHEAIAENRRKPQ